MSEPVTYANDHLRAAATALSREPVTYGCDHPGTSMEHLRAAAAHLSRALGLAMCESRDKDSRLTIRGAREMTDEAIEAIMRQVREGAGR